MNALAKTVCGERKRDLYINFTFFYLILHHFVHEESNLSGNIRLLNDFLDI
jgi:hypothetical protein